MMGDMVACILGKPLVDSIVAAIMSVIEVPPKLYFTFTDSFHKPNTLIPKIGCCGAKALSLIGVAPIVRYANSQS